MTGKELRVLRAFARNPNFLQHSEGASTYLPLAPQALLSLYPDLDRAYLDRRIHEETLGEHGIASLEA